MKKLITGLCMFIITVNVLTLCFLGWYTYQLDRFSSYYSPATMEELQERVTDSIIIPVFSEGVEILNIAVFYNISPLTTTVLEDRSMYQDRIYLYYVYTDKFLVRVDIDNIGITNPLLREGYSETINVSGFPVYVIKRLSFDTAQILDTTPPNAEYTSVELTMLAIINRQVIAISKIMLTSDAEAFYQEHYPLMLETMTLTLNSHLAKPIW